MKTLTIAIVGGSGFVGQNLVERLHADGHTLRVLTRNREQQRETAIFPRVTTINCDPYDLAGLRARISGCDVVINLVGVLQESGRSGRGFIKAHVTLTDTLITAAKQAKVPRLIQMSSLKAGQGSSHYLRTRGEAEARLRASSLAWTIFQPSVIFGPGDGLFERFASLLKIAPMLPLAQSGARFQPVWVRDVVEAFARALQRPDSIGKTYELGGPEIVTLGQVVHYTAKVLRLKRLILPLPNFVGAIQGALFDLLPAALKPFSSDNYQSLKTDSVIDTDGLGQLDIKPMSFRAIVPGYLGSKQRQPRLDRYRRHTDSV